MTIMLCCTDTQRNELEPVIAKIANLKVVHASCEELDEMMPVVIRVPEGTFFARVTKDRLREVVGGRGDDLKIQTARLFDVAMETYLSEPMHRRTVKLFRWHLDKLDECTTVNINRELKVFCEKYEIRRENVEYPVKMALVHTTKGPNVPELMEAFGKKDAFARIDSYLADYKYRI